MILYVNCCPRAESRTDELAKALLSKLGEYEELKLYDSALLPLNEERLNLRTNLISHGDFSHPMFDYAKQFSVADTVVISAPYWDLSFPSMLKIYLENIYVTGLTSHYTAQGIPEGLCKANKLYYVTTSGGPMNGQFGFEYVKALAQSCFGIKEVGLVKAEMLDIVGNDPDVILTNTKNGIHI